MNQLSNGASFVRLIACDFLFDESAWNNMHTLSNVKKKVQVGNNQEKAQSERQSLSKNRGGEKLTITPLYIYRATYRKPN